VDKEGLVEKDEESSVMEDIFHEGGTCMLEVLSTPPYLKKGD